MRHGSVVYKDPRVILEGKDLFWQDLAAGVSVVVVRRSLVLKGYPMPVLSLLNPNTDRVYLCGTFLQPWTSLGLIKDEFMPRLSHPLNSRDFNLSFKNASIVMIFIKI